MPNRILRPWLDSEAVNTLTDAEEVFFIRLIMAADDFGRFYGTPQLLKSYLYPLKDKRTADMPRLVAACEKAGMIASYEVSGRRYIQILKFKQQVRTAESKFPEPPPEILARCETSKKRGAKAKQMQSECVADDMQMNITCEADETQTQSNCTRNTETETKTDIKMVSELHSSTITPEPGKPGSPGRRNAEKTHLFFDYEGDSRIHGVTPELLAYWREMYPALDIEAELKKASAWLDGNRKNRKTDLKRFIVNWFNKAQDRAPRIAGANHPNGSHPSFDYAPDETGTDENKWGFQ